MNDFQGQIEEQRGKLKQLLLQIPGFKGYIEKEDRRTADKLLRETISDRYQELVDHLSEVQSDWVDSGNLEYIDDLEGVVVKLRTFIDRLRNATYGYSGFFDAIKVDQQKLDKIYDYDLALLDGADRVSELLSDLEDRAAESEVKDLISDLRKLARDLVQQVDKRSEVITE